MGREKNKKEEGGGAIGPFFALAKRGNPVLRSLPLCSTETLATQAKREIKLLT